MLSRVTHCARIPGVAAVAIIALSPGDVRAADAGDTGAQFLKLGVGARADAMGEAYVAVAQDPTATYWNPAGIATVPGPEIVFTHNEWISDVRHEYLAGVHAMQGHAVGFFVGLLHMGTLEGHDANGEFTGSFRAYDVAAGATYARRVTRTLELGGTGKVIYQRIADFDALGFAGDLGVRYRTPLRGLVLAGTLTNIGTQMKFVDQSFVLPFATRIGAAWRTRKLLQGFIVSSDVLFPNDSDVKGHVGGELWVHEILALRGGAKLGYDEELGTVGLGIKYRGVLFDYAYTPFSESSELGDTHTIAIGWQRPQRSVGNGRANTTGS
jgi:hypothetical protein